MLRLILFIIFFAMALDHSMPANAEDAPTSDEYAPFRSELNCDKVDELIRKLKADKKVAGHEKDLIACLVGLKKKIQELMKEPSKDLDDMIAAQADVSMLKVARAYLELQTIAGKAKADKMKDAIESAIKGRRPSTPDTREKAANLETFFQYIAVDKDGSENPFKEDGTKLLDALMAFSNAKLKGTPFALTSGDKYVFQNLYKQYGEDNTPAKTQPPEKTLLDTLFNQMKRIFKTRDLGQSDIRSINFQMNCKEDKNKCAKYGDKEGAQVRFDAAKKKFVASVKEKLKEYLKGGDHNCNDFYDPATLKLKRPYQKYENLMCSTGDFIKNISADRPFQDIESLLKFLDPTTSRSAPLKPELHARRMFHNLLSCKFEPPKNGSKDWWVELEIYVEHLHGTCPSATTWFINTGKPPTEETISGNKYNACDRKELPNPNYDKYKPDTFATSPQCIDRPLCHNVPKGSRTPHDTTIKVRVNLGDTKQDKVTIRGSSEPTNAKGVTLRGTLGDKGTATPRVQGKEGDDGNTNPVSTRDLDLKGCAGNGGDTYFKNGNANGPVTLTGITVISEGKGLGATSPAEFQLQAKTNPGELQGGVYHWTCGEDGPEVCRSPKEITSRYPNKNAVFPRLAKEYEVTVTYTSSVQKPETGAKATFKVPPGKAASFECKKLENNKYKIAYTGDPSELEATKKGLFKWNKCPPQDSNVCSTGKKWEIDKEYQFKGSEPNPEAAWQADAKSTPIIFSCNLSKLEAKIELKAGKAENDKVPVTPTLTLTPENATKKAKLAGKMKWECTGDGAPKGAPCDGKAEDGKPTDFPQQEGKEYTVTAKIDDPAVVSNAVKISPKSKTPEKPATEEYSCTLNTSVDNGESSSAKLTATVFKGTEQSDSSEDGTITWTYKSGDTSKTATGPSLSVERGNDDIIGNAEFKLKTDEKKNCSAPFTVKKKKEEAKTDEPGLEPLPEIPPSAPPQRFSPIMLPPMPGMFITPGFD